MVVNNATGHINTMTGVFCFQHNSNVESVKGQKKKTANTNFVTQRVFFIVVVVVPKMMIDATNNDMETREVSTSPFEIIQINILCHS